MRTKRHRTLDGASVSFYQLDGVLFPPDALFHLQDHFPSTMLLFHRFCSLFILVPPFFPNRKTTQKTEPTLFPQIQGLVMRIRARVFLLSALLLSLVAGPFIPMASADPSFTTGASGTIPPSGPAAIMYTGTISATGTNTVTISGTKYNVSGDSISGTFTYPATTTTPNGLYTFNGLSPAPTFTFTITKIATGNDTHPLGFRDFYSSGTYQAQVTFNSSDSGSFTTLALNGTMANNPTNPSAFQLGLTDTSNSFSNGAGGTYSSGTLPLPNTATIKSFFSPPGTVVLDGPGDGEAFLASVDTLDPLSVAPEPSSLLIATLTLVTGSVGFLIRRKPWTSQTGQIAPVPHP
jgi:hypothetical protein